MKLNRYMTTIINESNQSCLCQRMFNWQPQVEQCCWRGNHPKPMPLQVGGSRWYWYQCRTCGTKTHVSDHQQAALTEWVILNRNEQQHRDLWLRDYNQRQKFQP